MSDGGAEMPSDRIATDILPKEISATAKGRMQAFRRIAKAPCNQGPAGNPLGGGADPITRSVSS
jgi:hypothetical protein